MTALLDIAVDAKDHGSRPVLRSLRLRLAAGETVSLVGASGCGKSTLLSIAAGLDTAYRGSVRLDGQPLRGPSPDVGMVFQEPRLFPWLTVAQNIAFGAAPDAGSGARIAALLDEVGLAGHADALPKQLSGGQAQRAAIARGLFTSPRVLLLDEPFSAVDAFTRMRLQDLLVRVVRQRGLAVLVVTHDIDEALLLSERVVLMDAAAGPVRAEFAVELPRPRERSALAASGLRAAILDSLHAAHAF
ncbi:ABC transporter ATP-binding protein [Massilia sp. 9I]|uniref:ABC transporter ATP-binding protein n=1 Tax=Massilia sp. 9I TaxID=2653152 RepID=UPI0012F18D27|nr:ABC transporter ATP-binding protein [Massilia sp. 9I]VXB58985.1 alkanesulfonate transporter subunit; ATP-binding component of ABC superfamily [Massilia sp. 9I]